jgi:DNA polymerase-3 subunit beta
VIFSINKTELQNALNVVIKGVSTRSTLPTLSGILIDASGDKIELQSTDLEYSVKFSAPALVEEEGRTVVPGKLFCEIVRSLSDATVRVQIGESQAFITCDTSSFTVKTLNHEDFPKFPHVDTFQSIKVPYSVFQRMVHRVAKVVSKDESRAILTGILVTLEGSAFKMVATDSYRLAATEVNLAESSSQDFEAVISGTFLNEVASAFKTESDVIISLSENQIVIQCESVVFINRRIEGNYPNYRQLLPDTYTSCATLKVADLISGVKRASLFSSSTSPMKFNINSTSQTVQITVQSPEIGTAQETIPCEVKGDDCEIAFNSSYVLDGLNAANDEYIDLEVQSVLKPGILRVNNDERYLYLIMPVRI